MDRQIHVDRQIDFRLHTSAFSPAIQRQHDHLVATPHVLAVALLPKFPVGRQTESHERMAMGDG